MISSAVSLMVSGRGRVATVWEERFGEVYKECAKVMARFHNACDRLEVLRFGSRKSAAVHLGLLRIVRTGRWLVASGYR